MIVQPPKEVIKRMLELVGGTLGGLMNGLRLIRDCHGLVTFKARFHHAAFVMTPAFFTVLIAEMNLDTANMFREMPKRAFHDFFGMSCQRFVSVDRVVCVDLNFQNLLLCFRLGSQFPWCCLFFIQEHVTKKKLSAP
jgi:hypothetical protein